jgi:transposase
MAAKTITMLQIRRIIQLLHKGESIRSITRTLHLSRNTVRSYLKTIQSSGQPYPLLLAMDDEVLHAIVQDPLSVAKTDGRYQDFQPLLELLEEELKKTGVTRQLLWQEYRMIQPDGYGYTQFCYYLQEHLKQKSTVMRLDYKPAEKMLVDFAGKTLSYNDPEGNEKKCQVFIATLPFSGYTYTEAVHSQKQEDFVNCLENALKFFGGVPLCIVSDNLKSCVKRANRYEPELTELMERFALHYDTTVTAARVRKPRDKAPVEKAVHLAYQRIYAPLRHTVFTCLEDMNVAIAEQQEKHHKRAFRASQQSREDIFQAQEKNLLQPLPCEPLQMHSVAKAKVQRNYHIVVGEDWHFYSVPYQYVGKQVKIIYNANQVEVYHEQKRIALHHRNRHRNGYTTLSEHMPSNHKHYAQMKGWNADYFRAKGAAISQDVAHVIERLLCSRMFYEQTYNACIGILRLGEKYNNNRLSAACALALKANAITYKFISNVLKNNMDQHTSSALQIELPLHENLRGPEAYT